MSNIFKIEIVSGEGSGEGTVEDYDDEQTVEAVLDRLDNERCNGDRWAFAKIDGMRVNDVEIETVMLAGGLE